MSFVRYLCGPIVPRLPFCHKNGLLALCQVVQHSVIFGEKSETRAVRDCGWFSLYMGDRLNISVPQCSLRCAGFF